MGLRRSQRGTRLTGVPTPWPKRPVTCPQCRRPIPGAFAPGRPLESVAPRRGSGRNAGARTRLCPIDGELAERHFPQTRDTRELRRAAMHLASALHAVGDDGWARLFTDALSCADEQFMVHMGHALALLLRRGPVSDVETTHDEIEQLLVDVVATWPPCGAQEW